MHVPADTAEEVELVTTLIPLLVLDVLMLLLESLLEVVLVELELTVTDFVVVVRVVETFDVVAVLDEILDVLESFVLPTLLPPAAHTN